MMDYYQDYTGFKSHSAVQIQKPMSVTALQQLIIQLYQQNMPITVAGGLTGLTGSAMATDSGSIIGLENIRTLSESIKKNFASTPNLIHQKNNVSLNQFQNLKQKNMAKQFAEFSLATDKESAIFPAGIKLSEIDTWLDEIDRWYAPRPGEVRAQIGGNVATNASGPRTFSFGPTRDSVLGAEFLFPTGEIAWIERGQYLANGRNFDWDIDCHPEFISGSNAITKTKKIIGKIPSYTMPQTKHAAGLYVTDDVDLLDLIIGSEGILGIITAVKIKLEPKRTIDSRILFFDNYQDCLDFVDSIRELKLIPSKFRSTPDAQALGILSIEFFDANALAISDYSNNKDVINHVSTKTQNSKKNDWQPELVSGSICAVEIEFFAHDHTTERKILVQAKKYHVKDILSNPEIKNTIRYSVPKNTNELLRVHGQKKLSTDHAVPAQHFHQLFAAYQKAQTDFDTFCIDNTNGQTALDSESNQKLKKIRSAMWGHLSSYHLHLNFISRNEAEFDYGQQLYLQLAELAVSLGGTVSAEHGVGKKTLQKDDATIPYLQLLYSAHDLEEIRALKQKFDPKMLVCSGNMIGF